MRTGVIPTINQTVYKELIVDVPGQYPCKIWYLVDCRDYSKTILDISTFLPALQDLDLNYQAYWE